MMVMMMEKEKVLDLDVRSGGTFFSGRLGEDGDGGL